MTHQTRLLEVFPAADHHAHEAKTRTEWWVSPVDWADLKSKLCVLGPNPANVTTDGPSDQRSLLRLSQGQIAHIHWLVCGLICWAAQYLSTLFPVTEGWCLSTRLHVRSVLLRGCQVPRSSAICICGPHLDHIRLLEENYPLCFTALLKLNCKFSHLGARCKSAQSPHRGSHLLSASSREVSA